MPNATTEKSVSKSAAKLAKYNELRPSGLGVDVSDETLDLARKIAANPKEHVIAYTRYQTYGDRYTTIGESSMDVRSGDAEEMFGVAHDIYFGIDTCKPALLCIGTGPGYKDDLSQRKIIEVMEVPNGCVIAFVNPKNGLVHIGWSKRFDTELDWIDVDGVTSAMSAIADLILKEDALPPGMDKEVFEKAVTVMMANMVNFEPKEPLEFKKESARIVAILRGLMDSVVIQSNGHMVTSDGSVIPNAIVRELRDFIPKRVKKYFKDRKIANLVEA